jgi:hypothetical protein
MIFIMFFRDAIDDGSIWDFFIKSSVFSIKWQYFNEYFINKYVEIP